MRAIDADRLLTDRMKSKYYHLPNGDIAIPIIDVEHAPTVQLDPDTVSRQAVLDAIMGEPTDAHYPSWYAEQIKKLPPAQPETYEERKTGHWIDGKCNRCGTHAPYWAMASTYYCSEYCPHCGARMC